MAGSTSLNPKISVVIPSYNRANYILETVTSVLRQSSRDFEIIIVDDGSTDNTREILADLVNENLVRYIFQENSGESAARNCGISKSKGEYIAFLDSDDLFLPKKLEKQATFMDENPGIGLVHCWYSKFSDENQDLGRRNTSRYSGWVYPEMLLTWQVLLSPSCIMVRSNVLEDVGPFDVDQYWGADLDMWRRIAKKYQFGLIPEVLTMVRVHAGNLSARKIDSLRWFERYLLKAFEDDPELSYSFRKRAKAKMYANVAHNLLGEEDPGMTSQTRKLSIRALRTWPFTPGAYIGFLASFLPMGLRFSLLSKFRSLRNPAGNEY